MAKILHITFFILLYTLLINGQNSKQFFEDSMKRADTLVFQSKFTEAIDLYETMMQLPSLDALSKVKLLNRLSTVYCYDLEHDKALDYGRLAQSESIAINAKDQEAKALDNIGATFRSRRANLNEAMDLHQQALQLKLEHSPNDQLAIAYSHYHIGRLLHFNGLYENAIEKFESALTLLTENSVETKMLQLHLWYGLGASYAYWGDSDLSLEHLNKALDLASTISDEEGVLHISIYSRLASNYRYQYQPHKAILYYKKALELSIKYYGYDHNDQAKLHINIGTAYSEANQINDAVFHLRKSNDMFTKMYGENHKYLFNIYLVLGNTYNNEDGLIYLEKALDICLNTVGENHWKTALVYRAISAIYFLTNQFDEALDYAEKGLNIDLQMLSEDDISIIEYYNFLSKIYIKLKDFEKALAFNKKTLEANQIVEDNGNYNLQNLKDVNIFLTSLRLKGDIFLARYKAHQIETDLNTSISIYEQASLLVRKLRRNRYNYYDQIALSETTKSIYAQNIEASLLRHKLEQDPILLETAFRHSEESKGYTLAQIINQNEAKQIAHLPQRVLHAENKIDTTITNIQTEIVRVKSTNVIDSTQLYHWEGKLLRLNQKKDSLEDAIESQYPKYYDLKYAEHAFTVSQIQEQLDKHTTFLEFFKSETTLYAFIISHTNFHVYNIECPDLEAQIEGLQNSIKTKHEKDYYRQAHQLYEQLIAPYREHLVGKRLIIVPDASLWHLPFDALLSKSYDEKSLQTPLYLLRDFAISYANSAHFLFQIPKGESSKHDMRNECIAFSYKANDSILSMEGNAVLSLKTLRNTQVDLPGTRKEIQVLSKIYDGKYFFDSQANEANFKKEAQHSSIVHLALHGDIDNRDPRNSMLYFSPLDGDASEDNILYNHELFALDIPADLVVLSACNTGTGFLNSGEGIASLGQAFQYAGTKGLLLSKWEVSDKTAPEIMKGFYSYLKEGLDKSIALQKAKLDFLSTSDDFNKAPFYWGNFYLLGDSQAFENQNASFFQYVIYLLLLIAGIFFVYKRYFR